MTDFTLPAKVYNFIKYLVLIIMPGISTLYMAVANAWNWDHITNVSLTLAAITTFMGGLVGLSARNYNHSDAKYFGEIHTERTDEGAVITHQVFNEDPNGGVIADKKEVIFKVVQG
jgi:hypothetical protein